MARLSASHLFWVWAVLLAAAAGFINLPLNFEFDEIVGDLQVPTDFAFLPKGQTSRILVLEKLGSVFLIVDGVKQPETFLDIRHLVNSAQDRGCLGIEVDLDFESGMRYIYVAYVYEDNANNVNGKKTGRISRFTVNESMTAADTDSELILMGSINRDGCKNFDITQDVICMDSTHHALGGIEMATDRSIYFGTGDGANVGDPGEEGMRCQYISNNNGKVFRVDREGNGLPDNPYYNPSNPKSNESRLWALGIRQPFRLKVDEVMEGCVWVADVGRVDYEEVDLVCRNENHEWPCREGYFDHDTLYNDESICADMYNNIPAESASYDGILRGPVYAYERDQGTAITGADRLQVPDFPQEYRDAVYVMDYTDGWLRYFHVDESGKKVDGPFDFISNMKGPVQIRDGSDGCLWYLSLVASRLFRICYSEDYSVPTVVKVSPPNDLENVETSVMVEVTASKSITEESGTSSIVLTVESSGAVVEGVSTYDPTLKRIRFDPTNNLAVNTWYVITISGIEDFFGSTMNGSAVRRFKTGEGYTAYLSDLPVIFSQNGHDVRPVLLDKIQFGTGISHDGVIHEKGFGVVPYARVCVDIPEGCSRLLGEVAVDDFSRNLDGGALIFQIFVDGEKIWDSFDQLGAVLRRRDPSTSHDVLVEGGTKVCLDCVNGGWSNLIQNVGSWGSTRYRCGNFDVTVPSILEISVTPSSPSGGTPTDAIITVMFSEAMDEGSLIDAIGIFVKENGQTVGWFPDMSADLKSIRLGVSTLEYATEYCVSVSTRAQNLVGNRIVDGLENCFTTSGQPTDGLIINVVEELDLRHFNKQGSFDTSGFPRTLAPGLKTYIKGVGMKAWATATWDVSELRSSQSCKRLKAEIGVDSSEKGPFGKCQMEVTKQNIGTKLMSQLMVPLQPAEQIDVPVPPNGVFRLRALGGPDGNKSDYCNFGNVRLICDGGEEIFVSDITPRLQQGNIGYDKNVKNDPLKLVVPYNTFENGFVITPGAKLRVNIPHAACSTLKITVGIDESNVGGKMRLVVKRPGLKNCYSAIIVSGAGPIIIECDVTGAEFLVLVGKDGADGVSAGDIALAGNVELDCASSARQPKCEIGGMPESFVIGDMLELTAIATSYTGTILSAEHVTWNYQLIHCQPSCHEHPDSSEQGTLSGSYLIPDHGDYFYVKVECVVTDDNGSSVAEASVLPQTAEIFVNSSPPGQQIVVDSVSKLAPFSTSVVSGATFQIKAAASSADGTLTFSRWEHDEAAPLQFEVYNISSDETFTAVYEATR